MFMFAIAWGTCEAIINPLTATLYPEEKTHYLNILHAGWPGGLILGGLIGYFFASSDANLFQVRWEILVGLFLIPTFVYGYMLFGQKFPLSEARAAGVTYMKMLKEFAAPVLLFLLFLHVCVGYVELGTDSWIINIMQSLIGGNAFLLFIYTSALMFVLRFFAGPIVHRINPLGLLFVSAVLATIGLFMLGSVATGVAIILAGTIYGVGKTFFWPTMLAVVSERFPRGGALTLGAIGGIGMLSAGLLGGPGIG
jgi:MFS family permease